MEHPFALTRGHLQTCKEWLNQYKNESGITKVLGYFDGYAMAIIGTPFLIMFDAITEPIRLFCEYADKKLGEMGKNIQTLRFSSDFIHTSHFIHKVPFLQILFFPKVEYNAIE